MADVVTACVCHQTKERSQNVGCSRRKKAVSESFFAGLVTTRLARILFSTARCHLLEFCLIRPEGIQQRGRFQHRTRRCFQQRTAIPKTLDSLEDHWHNQV